MFPSTLRMRRGNLKTQESPALLDLCLRKSRAGKSHDYRDLIVFEISVDCRAHLTNKPAFSFFSGVVRRCIIKLVFVSQNSKHHSN